MSGLTAKIDANDVVITNSTLQAVNANTLKLYLRIAANAAGGVLKKIASGMATEKTGLLKKSFAVKVVNKKNGNWQITVGANRKITRVRRGKTRIGWQSFTRLKIVSVEGGASYQQFSRGRRGVYQKNIIKPSRYLHLAGKGRKNRFMEPAAIAGRLAAIAAMKAKLSEQLSKEKRNVIITQG